MPRRRARRARRRVRRARKPRVHGELGPQLLAMARGGITASMAAFTLGLDYKEGLTRVKAELTRLETRGLLVRSGPLYFLTDLGRLVVEGKAQAAATPVEDAEAEGQQPEAGEEQEAPTGPQGERRG